MWTYNYTYPDELYHHGILGQKWGVRRYQNADGSLTDAGKKRYLKSDGSLNSKGVKKFAKQAYESDTAKTFKESNINISKNGIKSIALNKYKKANYEENKTAAEHLLGINKKTKVSEIETEMPESYKDAAKTYI